MQNLSNPDNHIDGDIENAITAEGLSKIYQANGNKSEKKALKNINLEMNLDNVSDVIGDEDKLITVFSNLLDNAIKYSKENR